MSQLLDSPLEALAFNYVSFGVFAVVNNLWTWIAVVTAALSFWRIRTAAVSSGCVRSNDQKPSTSVSGRARDESRPVPDSDAKPAPSASVLETSVSPLVCRGVTKGGKFRFTVYYDDDDGETNDVETVTGRSDDGGDCYEWWESWERVLKLRNGETGWYRFQDRTALNGNVVRLWDETCKAQAVVL